MNSEISGESPDIDGGQSSGHLDPYQSFPTRPLKRRSTHAFDIRPGGVFPDYSFPDRTGTVRMGRLRS